MYQQTFSRSTPGCIIFLIDRSDSMRAACRRLGDDPGRGRRSGRQQDPSRTVCEVDEGVGAAVAAATSTPAPTATACARAPARRGSSRRCRARWPPAGSCRCRSSRTTRSRAGRTARSTPLPAAPGYRSGSSRCTGSGPRCARRSTWSVPTCSTGPSTSRTPTHRSSSTSPTGWSPTARTAARRSSSGRKRLTTIETSTTARHCCSTSFCRPAWPRGSWFPTERVHPPGARPGAVLDQQHAAREDGPTMPGVLRSRCSPGARGLVFNADLSMLVKFLEIGTRFDVRDR